MKKLLFMLFIFTTLLLLIPIASAKQGSLKLLAVQQKGGNLTGSLADLHLEIKSGSGRVFVDTFPLTKLDTQVSTRFAKEMACDYLEANCGSYDFFYTIRSHSPIIAGPSAGAAITALTISVLGDLKLSDDVALTGTINSGGIIGPVGGLKEKIEAAGKDGITKVLIPFGERYTTTIPLHLKNISIIIEKEFDDNITAKEILQSDKNLDLVKFGKELGIEVKEVSDINDVIFEFTGIPKEENNRSIDIDSNYKKIMGVLAQELCQRSKGLKQQLSGAYIGEPYDKLYAEALNLTDKGNLMIENERSYSAASYCFGANVKLGNIVLYIKNESNEELFERIKTTKEEIDEFKIPGYKTINDLQTYMLVDERIKNSKEFLEKSRIELQNGNKDQAIYNLAYAIERKFSAYAWSIFITGEGKRFRLSKNDLRDSCQKKLSEAEERYQYVTLFLPSYLTQIRKKIDEAYSDFNDENYEICLFKASRAKAEVDVILSVFGVEKKNLDSLIDRKLEIAKINIIKQIEKGIFPIVGYSHYEYAIDLKETDKFSSLLYGEYALEMSNLNIYFPEKRDITITDQDKNEIGIFLIGLGAGLLIGVIIMLSSRRKTKAKKKNDKKKSKAKKKKKN